MRRARRNPAPHPRVFEFYNRLIDAVDAGLRAIVDKNDGSAKVFQPLAKDTKLGTLEQEMDLLRTVVGGWKRTGLPYEAAAPRFVEFIAFAYAAERACRAAGETAAAQIFAFIRSCPVDASEVARGYPAKGGVSRVLMVSREMASIKGPSLSPNVHCTPEMLQMEKPLDALAFARSEMWPMGKEKWNDGWKAVDKKVRALRPMNCAWRGGRITLKHVAEGMLGAGIVFDKEDAEGIDVHGADLSQADISMSDLSNANISHSVLTDANLMGVILRDSDLSYSDMRRALLMGAHTEGVNITEADLTGAIRHAANEEIPGWRVVSSRLRRRVR